MTRLRGSLAAIVGFGVCLAASSLRSAPLRVQAQAPAQGSIGAVQLEQMQHHFKQIETIRNAVIRGDKAAVREPALALARMSPPPNMPSSAAPFFAAVVREAGRAAAASTLLEIADATSLMLSQCGECHHATSVYVQPPMTPKPDVGGLVGHMLAHQRAVDDMLLGLITPSPSLWRAGAEHLNIADLNPSKLPNDAKLVGELRTTDARVHQLAADGENALERDARVKVYSQLLVTCATCHTLHSRIWGPGRGR